MSGTKHDKCLCKRRKQVIIIIVMIIKLGHFSVLKICVGTRDTQLQTGTSGHRNQNRN